jgi:SAM-dependent methyltransferase
MHGWWLDETAHAGPEHLDEEYVAGYDRKSGFDPSEDVTTLRSLGVGSGAVVVDLGAGTGTFALAMAPHCQRVVAVDVSPAMRGVLWRRVDEARVHNVDVVAGGFLSYEHVGGPVDAVYTRNALHHLPDFWKAIALARVAAVVRPGGILRLHDLVFDFDPADADERVAAWMAGAVDDPADGWTAAELAEHVRTEFSTFSWLLDDLLDHAGFDVLDRSFRRAAYGTYTCRRRSS